MKHDMRILAWDIETRPIMAHAWGLWDQNISLVQLLETTQIMSFGARWYGDPKSKAVFFSDFHDGHENMVKAAWGLINEADALLSWNGKGFDTKHMNREFLLAELTPPSPIKEIDLMLATKARFKFISNKLEHVSVQLGLAGKVKHQGFDLWLKCMAGDPTAWAQMKKYNLQDVHLLIDLYDKLLPWVPGHPNVGVYGGVGCVKCGGHEIQKRGFSRTVSGVYQRYQCQDCGAWSKDSKSILTAPTREDR